MQIKDLFGKLIKDPTTRRDVEALLEGKVKILFEEEVDEKGKTHERAFKVDAVSKEDIESFRKFNTTNIRKNISESLFKYYQQKKKDLYKSYTSSIRKAIAFYDSELNKVYGAGFAEQFESLKEKEDAFSKMKFFKLGTTAIGQDKIKEATKLQKSPEYEKNKKEYDARIKELKDQYHTMKRAEFNSKKEPFEKQDIAKNFSNYREENATLVSLIEKIQKSNETTIYSAVEGAIGRLHEMETYVEEMLISDKDKQNFTSKIGEISKKMSTASDDMDFEEIIKQSLEAVSFMESLKETVASQKADYIKTFDDIDAGRIQKAKEELASRRALIGKKNAMKSRAKHSGEPLDEAEYKRLSELTDKKALRKLEQEIAKMESSQTEVIDEYTEMHDNMIKRIQEFQQEMNSKPLEMEVEKTTVRGEHGEGEISIKQATGGNLVDLAELTRSQSELADKVARENDKLLNIEENLNNASKIPEIENKLNDITLRTGKIEGSVMSPSEYIEQMMRNFGSYMLRIRLLQRGIQDITDAIGEFQKIDDASFQLGMVSDLNAGSIKAYRNEVLGLAADYRVTAEEIVNAQSEVVKSGRTFDQAKQQVSASLILARSTFEDIGPASEVLNKLMLTLEMNGSKAYETMSKLYNVVQNTPASLSGMEASMRQSSAAFSGLLDEIDYSGSQLDKYKDQLRDAELALVGFINLQGKTPQMAGTAVKTLVDKMRAPTDKAVSTINADLSRSGAMYQGDTVTAATIGRLTETNFNEAINLLSKLYSNGNLTYKAIQDMFGPRNAATISKLLYQVNGDIEKNSDDMLNKFDPMKDSQKLTQSWSQEMEELKNSFRALKGVANDFGDALLPVIDATGEVVQWFAKLANEHNGVKSVLQTGVGMYTVGKTVKNIGLSAYAMNQTDVNAVDEENQDMAIIGNLVRQIGSNGSAGVIPAIRAMISGLNTMRQSIWAIITSPLGPWIIGIGVAIASITWVIKEYQERVARADQATINATKSLEAIESSNESYNTSLKEMLKTMASLDPVAFNASSSIQILSEEIKNMLDMTMDYTGKLSSFSRELNIKKQLREVEQTINNDSANPTDKEKAKRKRRILEKALDEGGFSEDKIAKAREQVELYNALKDVKKNGPSHFQSLKRVIDKEEHGRDKDNFIRSIKNLSEKKGNKIDDKIIEEAAGDAWDNEMSRRSSIGELVKQIILPNNTKITKRRKEDEQYRIINDQIYDADAFGHFLQRREIKDKDGKVITLASSNLQEENEALIEVYEEYISASTKNIESIQQALSKEAAQIQDVNNYMNNLIKAKQASVFKANGNMLSMSDRVGYLSRDNNIKALLEYKGPDLIEKISKVNTESALQYIEIATLIKKNRDLAEKSISEYAYLAEGKKGSSKKPLIGSAKEVHKVMSKMLTLKDADIDGKEGKTFEEATKLSPSDLVQIIRRSKDSDALKTNLKEKMTKLGTSLTKDMQESLDKIIEANATSLDKSIGEAYVVGDMNIDNLDSVQQAIKGKFKDKIEVQMEILLNTTNEQVVEFMIRTLSDQGIHIADVLSARNNKKILENAKIIEASNNAQLAMDALILSYQNRVSQIATGLTSAQNKLESMGVVNFVANTKDVNRRTIEGFIARKQAEYAEIFKIKDKIAPIQLKKDIIELIRKDGKDESAILADEGKRGPTDYNAYKQKAEENFQKTNEGRVNEQAKSHTDKVEAVVNENGQLNKTAYDKLYNGLSASERAQYSNDVNELMALKKSIRNSLAIDPEDFRKSKQVAIQSRENIETFPKISSMEGMSGSGATAAGIAKTMIDFTSKVNSSLEDAGIALGLGETKAKEGEESRDAKAKRFIEEISNIKDPSDYQEKYDKIEKEKDPVVKSAMKRYLDAFIADKEELAKATSELQEAFRKLKNEMTADIYKINRETGKGQTYGKYDLGSYFKNNEEISRVYSEIQTLIGDSPNFKYETNENGVRTITGTENDAVINEKLAEVAKYQRANDETQMNLTAYINTLVQGQREIQAQSAEREYLKARESTNVLTPEGNLQKNETLFNLKLSKLNAWANVYNDILSSASSIPGIQKDISKNQLIILENTLKELKTRSETENSVAIQADMEKTKVQIAVQQIEVQRSELNLRIESYENEKKLRAIMTERRELAGKKISPSEQLAISMKDAYDQMRLSMEQLRVEREMRDAMIGTVHSLDGLKVAVENATKAMIGDNENYTPPVKQDNTITDGGKTEVQGKAKTVDGKAVGQEITVASDTKTAEQETREAIVEKINSLYNIFDIDKLIKPDKKDSTLAEQGVAKKDNSILEIQGGPATSGNSPAMKKSPTTTTVAQDSATKDEAAVTIAKVREESSKTELDNIKERQVIEQYINDIYKARLEYTNKIDEKYGKSIDALSAVITGKYENIKSEAPSLREGFIGLSSAIGLSKQGVDTEAAKNFSVELLKSYTGDISDIEKSSAGKYFEQQQGDPYQLSQIATYNKLSEEEDKKKFLDERGLSEDQLFNMESLKKAGEDMQTADHEDKLKKAYANAIIATVSTAMEAINSAVMEEAKTKLEGLQYEEKILNQRKAGYRTELAKRQIEDKIYENKMKQIDAQYQIDKATAGSQIGGMVSGIGASITAINPVAGIAMQLAGPIVGSIIGELDGDAKIKKAQAEADLVSEKNYKEYNDFWTLFFNTIKGITDMASQRIESLVGDYSSGRNRERLTAGMKSQSDINTTAMNSMNDFQGLGTVTENYKTKTWYGKNKSKQVKTALNYSFDDLSLDDIKEYASMSPESLKKLMLAEMKKDNAIIDPKDYSFIERLAMMTMGKATGQESMVLGGASSGGFFGLGGSKYKGADFEILDSDVTDFQESLIEAINAIEYLSREVGSLADKIFYADKEGYSSHKQSDVNSRYAELVANAKTAGNETLAKTLQAQWDIEMQKFKDGNVAEIFYSTFSSIIMEGAKKVAKETGKFSTAWATGIGEAYGTQFKNIISEIMNRVTPDNSGIDTYMEGFATKLQEYKGDLSQYIDKKTGVLDMDKLSNGVGAGSMVKTLTETATGLNELQSINFYNTSKAFAEQLRAKGLSENQIGTALESANLIDPLKVAVEKLSDVFNPLGVSSANLAMQRESFEANNSDRRSELNRKKILKTASTPELAELKDIETEDMKLSIKENVIEGFASGLKNIVKDTKYTSIFETFGSTIGESISSRMLADMDISKESSAIGEMIANEDYTGASKNISKLSQTMLSSNKKNLKIVQYLRDSGLDWTEIDSFELTENIYSKAEDIIKENSSLSKTIAKYAKNLIDYNNIMVNEKYTNEEYYTELAKRVSRGEELSNAESQWIKSYTEGLDTIISKQTLINSLESTFQSMLSESSSISVLKGIGASIGSIYREMIVKGIEANKVMESLVENVMSGKSINKQLSDISSIFQSAKNQQALLKRQMIAQGSSYTMIEAIFGEDYTSTIANIYGEMKAYSNALADITKKQEEYKMALATVNGITYTYDEYYRELNLKKANGIKLTKEEIKWTEKYSDTIKEFETNTSIVNSFYSAVSTAFSKESSYEMFGSFADGFSEILSERIMDGYLTNEFVDDMESAISLAQRALSKGSVKDLYSAQQQLIAFSTEIETAKNQTKGLLDMFNSSKLIDFTDKTNDVQYNASSSKDVTYNITQNLTLSAGNIIADGFDLSKLAKVLAPLLKPELKKV